METLYISHKYCSVRREGNHIRLTVRGETLDTIPLIGVKTVIVMDGVHLTAPATALLLENGVDIIHMSGSGKIRGHVISMKGGGAVLRLAQLSAFLDLEKRLGIAKSIVAAKIDNQMSVIRKYKYHDTTPAFDANLSAIGEFANSLDAAESINEIMGIEGVSARYYWDCFKHLLAEPVFVRREYRPAPDYVNALLNLGYSFLANELTTCLIAGRFDIEIGFLHSIHYGRNSLALDIMEEFRATFIDSWILGIVNKKQLKAEHFHIEGGDYRLLDNGFHKFCELYHNRVIHWRERFRKQVGGLKDALIKGDHYEPYRE